MNQESFVLWHVEDRVGHIVINRPSAANALSLATGKAFVRAVDCAVAMAGDDVRAVLLSSNGKQFCSGGDINEFVARRDDLGRLVNDMLDDLHPAIHALATLPIPVVSALQGPVGGAGIALALCADFVLASRAMKLRGGYSAIGLSPDLGASYYLSRRAGAVRAKSLLMTNRALSAAECLAWGIVDEVYEEKELLPAAKTLTHTLASGATKSLGGIKALCDSAFDHDLRAHLELERTALLRCTSSVEAKEGVSAFVDKRLPNFSNISTE